MNIDITHKAWHKMRTYVDLCPDEISGLGKVEIKDGNFIVTDIAIFKQVVSGAHSDIPAEALAKFHCELIKKGENPKDWFCWWHSHAAMKTFFSGRDTATIDESTDFKMMLSIVTNHKHEFSARFDLYSPVRMHQTCTVELLEEEDEEIIAECTREYEAKVTRPATVIVTPRTVGFHSGYLSSGWDKHDRNKGGKNRKPLYHGADKAADYASYCDEVEGLLADITEAFEKGRKAEVVALQAELYDKQIDGFYAGFEDKYPVKRV